MSLTAMNHRRCNKAATLTRRPTSETDVDEYNAAEPLEPVEVPVSIAGPHPRTSEDMPTIPLEVGDLYVFISPMVDVVGTEGLTYDGRTYEVVGPGQEWPDIDLVQVALKRAT